MRIANKIKVNPKPFTLNILFIHCDISIIFYMFQRSEVFDKMKQEKSKLKLKRRQKIKKDEEENPEQKLERLEKNVPKTIENTREKDETIVVDDAEVFQDEDCDEFASYFNGMSPKILLTTSRRPSAVFSIH